MADAILFSLSAKFGLRDVAGSGWKETLWLPSDAVLTCVCKVSCDISIRLSRFQSKWESRCTTCAGKIAHAQLQDRHVTS